ncbi:MAG TPA: hypothetical protein VN648_31635, partial [Candidatus Methylomirabilis sp.]|nr:hypothetical protein [Candidatus Methylomirabilis sp.]
MGLIRSPRTLTTYLERIRFINISAISLCIMFSGKHAAARIPLVGLISQYNAAEPPPGPNLMPLLIKRALIQGFIVSDHPGREADFLRDVLGWLKEGKIRYKEDVMGGLENAPRAFRGENF